MLGILLFWLALGNLDQQMRPLTSVEKGREEKILVTKAVEEMPALKVGLLEELVCLSQVEEFP